MNEQFVPVAWSMNTNVYEINLRQYTQEGTFNAFVKELPRLKDMGVEVLWFMPIMPISVEKRLGTLGSYYACSDYTSTNEEYGSVEDFKQLVEAAHALHLKVIIDWVANHTGWDHHWTREHPEYYRKNHDGNFFDAHGWMDVIDLNYDNPALHAAMLDAMRFWITECDIDGFRCDMAMLVPLSFWKMVRTELDKEKKLFWLAECEEISYHEAFDATYGWKLLHKMESFWRHETGMQGLNEVLHYYDDMFPPGALHLLFTTNHDENSHSGSEYERLGSAAKALTVLCCLWGGLPLIYSGQELPNKKRLKFFDKDPIAWNGSYELHYFFKKLLSLRKPGQAFPEGQAAQIKRLNNTCDGSIFAFSRVNGNSEILVLLNLSNHDLQSVKIYEPPSTGNYRNVFSSHEIYLNNDMLFNLKPWEYLVYEKMM